jgi:TonB family protein
MLTYIITTTIYLSVFYLFTAVMMRKTTFFRFNRIMFLAGTVACMCLPFLEIPIPTEIMTELNETVVVGFGISDWLPSEAIKDGTGINIPLAIYLMGVCMTIILTVISYYRMLKLIHSIYPEVRDGLKIRIVEHEIASFSWGRNIVISRSDYEENPEILKHETMHVRCGHSIDLLAYTAISILHWFNPLVWFMRTEIKTIHEYEADGLTLKNDTDAYQYQMLLVKTAVGAKSFQLANGFNHSKLKKRICMMHTDKTNGWARLAYALCVPLLMGAMCCCTEKYSTEKPYDDTVSIFRFEKPSVPFYEVEEKPTFQGGDAYEFSRWVNMQLIYPEGAKARHAEGRVTISFTVNEKGKVKDVRILRGADPELDKEALRVVSMSPDWTPGRADGKTVPVTYTFPIIFQLR